MADTKFDKWGNAARDLYVKHGKSLADIAALLDISTKTIGEWSVAGQWVKQRKSYVTRPAEIVAFAEDILYNKLQELRDLPPGQIDSGVLDGLSKLMKRAEEIKRHTGLLDRAADVMDYYVTYCQQRLTGDAIASQMQLINGFLVSLEETL